MTEEYENNTIKHNPLIIMNKIKDELENKRSMIMNRISDNEEFLFNKAFGKVPNLQKIIDYDSDYQQLRIVKDMSIIIDKITKLTQEYITLLNLHENAFKELYDYCSNETPLSNDYDNEIEKIKKKLERQEDIIKKKNEEIEYVKNEGFEAVLANTDIAQFFEHKAKADPNMKVVINKLKKQTSVWEKLNEISRPKQVVLSSDIKLDESFLPNFDEKTWEYLKKYDYLTKMGKTIDGRRMDTIETFTTVCNLTFPIAYEYQKKHRDNCTNLMFTKKLQTIELTDGFFIDRAEEVKNGRIKITERTSQDNNMKVPIDSKSVKRITEKIKDM